jgi:hypothetical protein
MLPSFRETAAECSISSAATLETWSLARVSAETLEINIFQSEIFHSNDGLFIALHPSWVFFPFVSFFLLPVKKWNIDHRDRKGKNILFLNNETRHFTNETHYVETYVLADQKKSWAEKLLWGEAHYAIHDMRKWQKFSTRKSKRVEHRARGFGAKDMR